MSIVDKIEPWMLVVLALSVLVLIAAVRGGAKAARKTREVSRMGGNTVRTLLTTAAIGGAQWLIIANATDPRVTAAALAVPAFVTAALIVRALTVTTTEHAHTKGGKR
ncbi:hypothetical protein FKR81_15100 [Lentzea tibetensis]|uniref:Uncharacterized protein n=1 Tax=Lentzea tibetensis TaxID=2591470 RepID=A0A563EV06_9PSEU|nr:hypothetical protein [Lentzea tibetensis]TWP51525.1 hypothetical protein FKR81_15100 [Lentzea tibetensis]